MSQFHHTPPGQQPPQHQPRPSPQPAQPRHGTPQPLTPLAQRSARRRFRPAVLLVPMAIAAALYLISGMRPVFRFADIADWLGVVNENRYAKLGALCVGLVGLTLVLRFLIRKEDQR